MGERLCSSKRSKTTTTTITDLPDDVLVRILSLLSTDDAVKTVLIRGFSNLWQTVPVLDFDSRGIDVPGTWEHLNDGPLHMISHVLDLQSSNTMPLDRVCVRLFFPKFDPHYTKYPPEIINCLKKLILHAKRRKVKYLDLNFNVRRVVFVELMKLYDLSDHHVLVSDDLIHLRLTACSVISCWSVNLPSLKVLYLHEVTLTNVHMEQVLVGCPSLEDLSLFDCLALTKLTCTKRHLTKLTLFRNKNDFKSFEVSCPHVLQLELSGVMHPFVLLDVSSVVDVSIHPHNNGYSYCIGTFHRTFWELMKKTSHCKIFRGGGWVVEELAVRGRSKFSDWPSFCYKSLVMEMGLRIENQPGIALLLQNSQSLETLTLHFQCKGYHKFLGVPVCEWVSFGQGEAYWKTTFPSLVTINIYGDLNNPFVFEILRVLLRCAIGLKKVVVSAKDVDCPFGHEDYHYTSDQLLQLSNLCKEIHPASPEAVVYFNS